MASDFLAHLKTLEEHQVHARCKELQDEVPRHLESCDVVLQAQIIDAFIQKTIIKASESEAKNMFKILLPPAIRACDSAFEALQAWDNVQEVLKLIWTPIHILGCISACCLCAQDKEWTSSSLMTDLLQYAFHSLKATYSHCQDSVLESVNEPLTQLFRAATTLQAHLHQLCSSLATSDGLTEDDMALLTSVCDDLAVTGRLLTRLDARAMAEAWKCYLRLLQLLPERLPASADLPRALTFMAGEVTDRLAEIRQTAADKASGGDQSRPLSKALKMCGFYLKLAVGLSESYTAQARGAFGALTELAFTLTRQVPDSTRVSQQARSALSQSWRSPSPGRALWLALKCPDLRLAF
ncbi:uncharacterized protein LOC119100077 [Pollicipes pollicipes]|uniref:uncharacterized protein LOC119100077 n=1 Tax=Pollicipes pollicipes TaxID=41117 RepID=UPI001885656F|nr:uncharacterized protein LOC119100077 [Pollicipes pollicipes]